LSEKNVLFFSNLVESDWTKTIFILKQQFFNFLQSPKMKWENYLQVIYRMMLMLGPFLDRLIWLQAKILQHFFASSNGKKTGKKFYRTLKKNS
jgi:hypothetical protein